MKKMYILREESINYIKGKNPNFEFHCYYNTAKTFNFIQMLPCREDRNAWADHEILNLHPSKEIFKIPFRKAGASYINDVIAGLGIMKGLFLSNKLKAIIEQLSLPHHFFFDGKITLMKQENPYYYLYLPILKSDNLIDFNLSKFYSYHTKTIFSNGEYITKEIYKGPFSFKNQEELNQENTVQMSIYEGINDKTISAKFSDITGKLYLQSNVSRYDILNLDLCSNGFIISEKLRNLLIENNITGIEIIEAPWIIVE